MTSPSAGSTAASGKGLHIVNLGAGVQSTTLYLMFMRGELTPQIDAAIFADTQDEPQAVYRHLKWLKSLGGPRIVTVTKGRLGDDLMHGVLGSKRFASIPAFTSEIAGEKSGITLRQCSREYKTEVIQKAIRYDLLGLAARQRVRVPVVQYFGISMDEARRAVAVRNKLPKWSRPAFPLMDRFMTRADCLTWLATFGNLPHECPRSACVYCPYHSDAEWERVKANPTDWARAVEVDQILRTSGAVVTRKMKQRLFVHDSCVPLPEVVLDPKPRDRQMPMSFYQECEGVCGV